MYKSISSFKSKYCFSSSFKFMEFISSPGLILSGMIFKWSNSSWIIITLFYMSFITFINIIMEWIFERKSVEIIGALYFNGYSSNNSFIWSPWVRNKSSSIEESRSNDVGFKIFLYSTLFHMPSDNFDWWLGIISDLNLMKSEICPIVTLLNISWIEVIMDVMMMSEIIGWIDVWWSH